MIRPFSLPLIFCLGLAACATTSTREPVNLSTAKIEVKAYLDSGAYEEDLAAVAGPERRWITKRASQPGAGKLAVIFDIDETTLSNLKHMQAADWGYQPPQWDAWVRKSAAPAIVPLREVYQTAHSHGVAVFFITGRKERDRIATARNLRTQGMGGYAALIVRPNNSSSSAKIFKSAERKRITEQGYTIIANIGDQQTDLDGGYAERSFKLPNPFYLIP